MYMCIFTYFLYLNIYIYFYHLEFTVLEEDVFTVIAIKNAGKNTQNGHEMFLLSFFFNFGMKYGPDMSCIIQLLK